MNEYFENSHQEFDDENFYEEQIRSKKEITQLKEEINVLKNQYEEAMSFTTKVEEFAEENKNLKKQIMEIRLSNDDLTRRLQISQQTIADLTKEIEKNKSKTNDSCYNEITDLQTQLGIAKTENINISSRYQQQISELKSSIYAFESENALLKKQQQKILNSVGQYLNQTFQNPEELCRIVIELKNKPAKQEPQIVVEKENQTPEKDEKIQYLKSKYQSEKEKRKDLQMSILKMKKKLEQQNLEHEDEISNYNDKITQQANEIKRLELLNQQKLLPVIPSQPELKSIGCQIILSTIDETEQISNYKQQVAKANSQIDAQDSSISILKTHNDSLIKQLEDSKLNKDQLASKIKQLTSRYNEIERELHQQKKENASLKEKLNQQNQKNKNNDEQQKQKNEYELKIKLMNDKLQNEEKSIENLEELLNKQKDEISNYSINKDKMIAIIEKQNQILNLYSNELMIQKVDDKKTKVVEKIVTIEPKFEWNVGNIPDEIQEIVHDITGNESMSIESRIKSVFIIINKWIAQNISTKDNDILQLNQKYQSLNDEYNEFKNRINTLLELGENNQSNEQIINTINRISEELEKSKNQVDEMNQLNDQLYELSNVNDFESLVEKHQLLTTENQQLNERIENEMKKRKSLKKQYYVILTEKEKEIASLKEMLHSIKDNSKKQINSLQKTINELQTQNEQLIERIKDHLKKPHHKIEEEQQQPKEANHYHQQNENVEYHHKDQINNNTNYLENSELSMIQFSMEKEELQDQLKNMEASLKSWKEAVNQAREENSKLLDKIDEEKQKSEKKITQLQKKHEIEIFNQNNTIQELSNQMKRKEEDHQIVINRLNKAIQHTNKLYEESLQKINNLTYSFENDKKLIEARIETIERAKKLSEAQLKAKILSLDSNYAVLIEEEKQKGETEKRELIEFFAKTFRNFADINIQLDENSFHEMVLLVKSKIDKHQRSEDAIRKLIKANQNESIEESITQFIIQHHPQLKEKPK